MSELTFGILSAVWLGFLTAISPCPMATNVAAISFVGRRVDSPRRVLIAGLLYTVGRTATYVLLGVILAGSLLSAPFVSQALQAYMNKLLGPLLIVVGLFLLDLISLPIGGSALGARLQSRAEALGLLGALMLGVVFALSFCPTSAALFFGSLVPLAVKFDSALLVPTAYGVATGLPVVLFAALLALGAHRVAAAFNRLRGIERWARLGTGVLFILVGIYFTLVEIWGLGF